MNFYIEAFKIFFKIGAFTIGGGYAMVPLIEDEIVTKRKWIGQDDFLDLLAIAQSAPGILAVNIAIFVGYRLRGVKGSLVTSLGSILPSFLTILAIAVFFTAFKDNPYVERAFKGIRPVVVSLILVPMVKMARTSCRNIWTWLVAIVSLLLVAFLNVSPIYIILCVLVLGFSVTYYKEGRWKR